MIIPNEIWDVVMDIVKYLEGEEDWKSLSLLQRVAENPEFNDRDVARIAYYCFRFGVPAVPPGYEDMCMVFVEPQCPDGHGYRCITPEHQVVVWK